MTHDEMFPRTSKTLAEMKACPHCEYDRKFPETASGGWIYPGNNGAYYPCPICNPDGKHPRD